MACKVLSVNKSNYYYKSVKGDDSEVERAIRAAAIHGEGFLKIFMRIRKSGKTWNHKKVYRVYRKMGLSLTTRERKRTTSRVKLPLAQPEKPRDTWSIDFVSDKLSNGRTFRVLTVVDDCTREAIGMEVSMSFPASKVVKALDKLTFIHGKPKRIRSDNGPEFVSKELADWCDANGVEHIFSQPGCPTQNAYIERFNGSYRRGLLDRHVFKTLTDAKILTAAWQFDYNNFRPHEALDGKTPTEYVESRP